MMDGKRQVSRDLRHAIQHIENGEIELALNMLKEAVEREKEARRNTDREVK